MPLTPEDVSRIAHLARLELDPAEAAAMLTQLNGFFRIVGQMSAVDTSGVEPLYTPLSAVQDVHLRLREDAVTETDQRALNQRSAPLVEDGLFLVPQVIGGRSRCTRWASPSSVRSSMPATSPASRSPRICSHGLRLTNTLVLC